MVFALLIVAGVLPSGSALAESGLLLLDAPPAQATLAVGVSVLQFPRYGGSAASVMLPLPAVEWLAPSGAFASTTLGVGWNLSARRDVQWGVRFWPQPGRHSSDSARLQGLPDIPLRLQRSVFANWEPVEFAVVQSALNTGLGPDTRGVLAEAGITLGAPLGPHVLAGLTLGASYANAAYRQGLYGITPVQALAAGRSAFSAGAGWQDQQAALSAEWTIAKGWRFDAHIERHRLLGAAAASPVAESRWQSAALLSLWHDLAP